MNKPIRSGGLNSFMRNSTSGLLGNRMRRNSSVAEVAVRTSADTTSILLLKDKSVIRLGSALTQNRPNATVRESFRVKK